AIPILPNEPTVRTLGATAPSKQHALSPFGYLVVGVNDEYSFDVRRSDGRVVRIERVYEPVEFLPEERAELQAVFDWFRDNNYPVEVASVPDHKLPYGPLLADEEDRIWVRRHVPARKDDTVEQPPEGSNRPPATTWGEPGVYDVFEPDGTYLGEVRFPWLTRPLVVRGDTAWGVRRGESGEDYIVRLVMSREASGEPD
ncbi:MAG TPA: hypothetical protein VLA20_04380, partial [Vicinamibacterales bacterium]|nr:hypothetical protein [Vicinamibacterales bacterium]